VAGGVESKQPDGLLSGTKPNPQSTNDRVQQTNQTCLVMVWLALMSPRTFSKNACVFFFDGLTKGLPSYLRRFCPRKSNPSLICVMRVQGTPIATR